MNGSGQIRAVMTNESKVKVDGLYLDLFFLKARFNFLNEKLVKKHGPGSPLDLESPNSWESFLFFFPNKQRQEHFAQFKQIWLTLIGDKNWEKSLPSLSITTNSWKWNHDDIRIYDWYLECAQFQTCKKNVASWVGDGGSVQLDYWNNRFISLLIWNLK